MEDRIGDIFKGGIQNQSDVARILAWKIGKIKHRDSQDEQKFVYAKKWEDIEQIDIVKLYKDDFPIGEISSYVVSVAKRQKDMKALALGDKNKAQKFLNEMKEKGFKRIGTVYMITLLYFLSRGAFPIYDRFAMMALTAIFKETSPISGSKAGIEVRYKELPTRESTRFSGVIDNEMDQYMGMLNRAFGDEWKTNRKIDQALWVYGHLFKMK
ncbi:MAG: hypothetical protein IJH07_03960 [Ruminococcus sp.]|nr:hypothetical protein [Ruminococcus sp.]